MAERSVCPDGVTGPLFRFGGHQHAIPHQKLRSSDRRYEFWHERYLRFKKRYPDRSPVYYDNRSEWMR